MQCLDTSVDKQPSGMTIYNHLRDHCVIPSDCSSTEES